MSKRLMVGSFVKHDFSGEIGKILNYTPREDNYNYEVYWQNGTRDLYQKKVLIPIPQPSDFRYYPPGDWTTRMEIPFPEPTNRPILKIIEGAEKYQLAQVSPSNPPPKDDLRQTLYEFGKRSVEVYGSKVKLLPDATELDAIVEYVTSREQSVRQETDAELEKIQKVCENHNSQFAFELANAIEDRRQSLHPPIKSNGDNNE